jgi:hypothetical protein
MDLQELVWGHGLYWSSWGLGKSTFVNSVMNFVFHKISGNFMTIQETISFSRRTLFHGVSQNANIWFHKLSTAFYGNKIVKKTKQPLSLRTTPWKRTGGPVLPSLSSQIPGWYFKLGHSWTPFAAVSPHAVIVMKKGRGCVGGGDWEENWSDVSGLEQRTFRPHGHQLNYRKLNARYNTFLDILQPSNKCTKFCALTEVMSIHVSVSGVRDLLQDLPCN